MMYYINIVNRNRIDSFYHILLETSEIIEKPVIGFDTYVDESSSSPLFEIISKIKEKDIKMVMVKNDKIHHPLGIKLVNNKEELEKECNIIVDVKNVRIIVL